jgi:hypothetical protein
MITPLLGITVPSSFMGKSGAVSCNYDDENQLLMHGLTITIGKNG